MKLLERSKCTGCMACLNSCPMDAVFVQEDACGFEYPQIKEEKCINCGRCKAACPILCLEKVILEGGKQTIYAGWYGKE